MKISEKLLLFFIAMLTVTAAFAGDFDDKGLISDWCFTPLQVDAGLINNRKLFDEKSNAFLALGVFILEQKSAVVSFSFVANALENNYGIQLPSLILGALTHNNYGISFGWQNYCKKCYGMQIGILNNSWAGEKIEANRKRWQLFGINIADTVYMGLVNVSNQIQIGLFNFTPGAAFQVGLLNYNPKSYIPCLPIINFDMQADE